MHAKERKMSEINIPHLVCRNCGAVNSYSTELKSNQLVATCDECNSYIKNIPYNEPTFYFGKYKGFAVCEIDDVNYLEWALFKTKPSKRMREALESRIKQLQNK